MMEVCKACREPQLSPLLDLGEQAIASHFLHAVGQQERRYHIAIGQCTACATVQLIEAIPAYALTPPYSWIVYREPEPHLDALVESLIKLPGLSHSSCIAGLTSKDDTTLDRFRSMGFSNTWRLDPKDDLGIDNPSAGIESVQLKLSPQTAVEVLGRRAQADLIIVRHIMEHAEDLSRFIEGMTSFISPDGYIMIEVPDAARNLSLCDYTMIWEEHVFYFTQDTLISTLRRHGLEPVCLYRFPYQYEDSLCIVVRRSAHVATLSEPNFNGTIFAIAASYGKRFSQVTSAVRASLESWQQKRGKIAIFGAGHLTCAFINYHSIGDLIEFVVDDSPHKRGLFMPGSRHPIVGSDRLQSDQMKLCLLGLSPDTEETVIAKNLSFTAKGGSFGSILRGSQRYFMAEGMGP